MTVQQDRDSIWALVHTERKQLAQDLADISSDEWHTESLCAGWSVHDVLAHLLDTAMTTRRSFVWTMIKARGDFHKANAIGIDRYQHHDPNETLAAFEQALTATNTPPAAPATRLVEAYVHGEDIRRPLGIRGNYPQVGLHHALEYQLRTRVSFEGGRERAAGLQLRDSESDVTWGEGPEVTGTAIDLLLAVSGRTVSPTLFAGPGAPTLVERASE